MTRLEKTGPQTSRLDVSARHAGLIQRIRFLLARAEVDRSVVFAVIWRVIQAFVGLGSLIIIPRFFTRELQGYYYTFTSLAALTSLMELGLHSVIINLSSHEWSRLQLKDDGEITGDPEALSRLSSLGRQVFVWYAVAAALAWIVLSLVGWVMLSRGGGAASPGSEVTSAAAIQTIAQASEVDWKAPWLVLCLLTGLVTWALPFVSMLEGCNQVAAVFKVRMLQSPLVAAATWTGILMGWGLWAVPLGVGAVLGCDLWILLVRYRRFWRPFFIEPQSGKMHWMREIWPMQWRLAVSALGGYFMFWLYNPVIFLYHGPAEAGRMGMTLQILAVVQSVGQAWTQTRAPQFGILVARHEYSALDVRFFRTALVSTGVVLAGGLGFALCVELMHRTGFYLSDRILPTSSTLILVAQGVVLQICMCQTFYFRAHKREPIMVMGLVAGGTQGLLVWWWGSQYGSTGAAWAALVTMGLICLPWETLIWIHARKHWRV